MNALTGRVRLGRILIRAGDPVALAPEGDVRAAVGEVRNSIVETSLTRAG